MPTRTDIVIKLGEVIDCLPPSKAFRRRRYNSFDANSQGNEENLAPELSGVSIMKPVVKLEAEDDDEVSFRYNNGDSESSRRKPKRKTSAEKFLEDNVNYFQLEVLPSKTRSNKRLVDNGDSGDDEASKEGFHDSFLNFLKSKGVEKEESNGRSRHKSEGEREGRSRTVAGRSRSSHSPYHRSRSSHRAVNGRSKSRGRSKSKAKLGGGEDCEQSASESSDTGGRRNGQGEVTTTSKEKLLQAAPTQIQSAVGQQVGGAGEARQMLKVRRVRTRRARVAHPLQSPRSRQGRSAPSWTSCWRQLTLRFTLRLRPLKGKG